MELKAILDFLFYQGRVYNLQILYKASLIGQD